MPTKTMTRQTNDLLDGVKVMQLVASGHTIRSAAAAMKITEARAKRLHQTMCQRTLEESSDLRNSVLATELETLRMMQLAYMPGALRGHPRSGELVLAIMDKRHGLLGMKDAIKVQVEVRRVDEALAEIVQIVESDPDSDTLGLVKPLRRVTAVPDEDAPTG